MSVESFSYGSEVVGGSTPTHDTDILTMFYGNFTQDDAEFVVRFAVRITPSATPSTDWTNLATACNAVEQALRKRYQKLTVDWGSSNQETWDPAVAASAIGTMGFDQEPNLRKLTAEEFPNSNAARGYEIRIRLGLPPNYTDTFGAAAGRRQVDVDFHYDVNLRPIVTMRGQWTQTAGAPGKLGRDAFLAAIDGVSGYAAYRLSLINASVSGLSAATWAITSRNESDPNSLSTLNFTRVYEQHVNGRRESTVQVVYGDFGQRAVVVRGSYLRTQDGTGGTYGNVYGTAAGSLTNYGSATTGGVKYATATQLPGLAASQGGALTTGSNAKLLQDPVVSTNEQDDRTDYTLSFREFFSRLSVSFDPTGLRVIVVEGTYFRSLGTTPASGAIWGNIYGASAAGSRANFAAATTGGLAWAVTQLGAMTAAQGGALTVGTDCELVGEPAVATDDLDDRTDYRLVYRELLQKQSTAATALDDPNIVQDAMQFYSVFTEVADSPLPAAAATIQGPGGSQPSGAGAGGSGQTGPRQAPPPSGVVAGGGTGSGAAGSTPVVKPIDVFVHYEAWILKSVTTLAAYWESNIKPLLIQTLVKAFPSGNSGVQEFALQKFQTDPTSNRISADLHFRAYQSNVILFQFSLGIFNELGVRVDPAFTGNPHEYLVQQALPKTTMSRKVEAVYVTGSYSLDQFKTPPALQGWVKLADAMPSTVDKVVGILAQGVGPQLLTYASLEENLIWVAKNVAGSAAAGGGSNITYTPQGTGGSQTPQAPPQAADPGFVVSPDILGVNVDAFGHGI